MNSTTHDHVSTALQAVLDRFESGEIAEDVALAVFPGLDVPSAKWSLMNRIMMMMAITGDARGFKQWKEAGRNVKKGARSFRILGPDDGPRLIGFVAIPVFRVEDTEGTALDYEAIELPEFPLIGVARAWGIPVQTIPFQGKFLGMYHPTKDQITMASPEEKVFFHELAHAAHGRALKARGGSLKGGQDWKQEIVAELSATVLCLLAGRSEKDTSGHSYRYISNEAAKAGKDVLKGISAVISDVDKVLRLIIGQSDTEQSKAA